MEPERTDHNQQPHPIEPHPATTVQMPNVTAQNNSKPDFFNRVLIGIVIFVIFIIAALLFFMFKVSKKERITSKSADTNKNIVIPTNTKANLIWEKQYIELYGIELELPQGWTLKELNRRNGEYELPSLYGHDCADYQIKSSDGYITLNLYPVCIFAEGFPHPWPDDTVIVRKEKTAEGAYLVRYLDKNQSKYVYTYGWDNGERSISDPPFFAVGNDQNSYLIANIVSYSGPKERTEEYLKIVDTIILSLKIYKNTVTIPPTPTPVTFNWLQWNSEYGFNLKHPPEWFTEKECTDVTGVCWVYFNKSGDQSYAGRPMMITVYPSWRSAGYETGNIPTHEKNNYVVGGAANIPAWIYRDALQSKDETKTDHYEDRIYFELKGKVFHMECFHDKDPQFIETCSNIGYSININE